MPQHGSSKLAGTSHVQRITLLLFQTPLLIGEQSDPFLGLTEAEEIVILGSHPHSVAAQKIAYAEKMEAETRSKGHVQETCVGCLTVVRELTSWIRSNNC